MKAFAETPALTLEQEVLDLWREGFDTACIAEVLSASPEPRTVAEADVAKIVAAETDRRYAARLQDERHAARTQSPAGDHHVR